MDGAGKSGCDSDFVHWHDLIDANEDSDTEASSTGGDEEMNSDPVTEELETLLVRLYRVVKEVGYHVHHPNQVVCIP
jgi:hypothetical protein